MSLQWYADLLQGATIETLAQQVGLFNESTGGALRLTGQGFQGDYLAESFFSSLESAQYETDYTGANNAKSALDISQGENIVTKVGGGFKVKLKPSELNYLKVNTALAIEAISKSTALSIMKDQLNRGVLSAVTAVESEATVTNDISATLGITQGALNDTYALFGDSSQNIVCNIMRGSTQHKLIGQALTNGAQLFTSDSIKVIDIQGKISVISDIPALYEAGTPNKEKILSLVENGLIITDGSDMNSAMTQDTSLERIETTYQTDYRFGIDVKGWNFDKTIGSPKTAALGTPANWTQNATDIKNTAGVILVGDSSK
jgi:hypothetical protein